MATNIIESAQGRYEVQDVAFGRVYRWHPESVVLDCGCGERLALSSSTTVCECGADHDASVREELDTARLGDEKLHPWRYAREREDTGIPI